MSLFSLILALLLEQRFPLPYARWVARPVSIWAEWLERHLNAGSYQQGVAATLIATLLPLAPLLLVYILCLEQPILALAFNALILYLTLGFRQFSHFYTDIQMALRLDDTERAHALLSEWRNEDLPARLEADEIAQLAIETALVASHRHVFAVIFWFVLLPGPLGAVLYRITHLLAESWNEQEFGRFAADLFRWLEWLPARATATAFAIVGNFEDAVFCWRNQASRWYNHGLGIVIAGGAGALGIKLKNELGTGEAADVDSMQSAVGLVWRAILLWCLLLILSWLASLAG